MATEQKWKHIQNITAMTEGDLATPENGPFETWSTQAGAQTIFYIKQMLVEAGWTVVSSSARVKEYPAAPPFFLNPKSQETFSDILPASWVISDVKNFITGTLVDHEDDFTNGWDGTSLKFIHFGGTTVKYYDDRSVSSWNNANFTFDPDIGLNESRHQIAGTSEDSFGFGLFQAAASDLWTVDELEPKNYYKRIYPGLVNNVTTSTGSVANGYYKCLESYAYEMIDASSITKTVNMTGGKINANFGTVSINVVPGRAWCLLKAPVGMKEAGYGEVQENDYHILLDYVSAPYNVDSQLTKNPNLGLTAITNAFQEATTWSKTATVAADFKNSFGSHAAIYVFPSYGNDSLSNLFGEPTTWRRPHHKNEIAIPATSVAFTTDANKTPSAHLFRLNEGSSGNPAIGDTAATAQGSEYILNMFYSYDRTGTSEPYVDTPIGHFNLFCTKLGTAIFQISANKIADPLHHDITPLKYNATKHFFFWSSLVRASQPMGAITPIKTVSADDLTVNLSDSIFDGREPYQSMFYYSKYRSVAGYPLEFIPKRLVTCAPVFGMSGNTNPTYSSRYINAAWFKNTQFSKTTIDYTYVEWPLPLIDVNDSRSNYRYVGRMSDVKLGPGSAPNGVLAKQDGSDTYDRFLINGLWYGCDLIDTIQV